MITDFMTEKSAAAFPHIISAASKYMSKSGIFEPQVLKRIFEYTLFEPKEHTFERAARTGNLEVLKYLVQTGENIKGHRDDALISASENGHFRIVRYIVEKMQANCAKYLLENGADFHADRDFAFRISCREGRLEAVKFLLEKGADIHSLDDYAFRYASERGHLEIVKYLIEQGADFSAAFDRALSRAKWFRNREVVEYLTELKREVRVML